ncbi:MAG: HAMP domain-containing histidine kinase [Lentisphaeraceae bacterium]|nr:HAMP domain-containing histidine kinase [Lentisphaeraceae bacterium]
MSFFTSLKFRLIALFVIFISLFSIITFSWLQKKYVQESLENIDNRLTETAKFLKHDFEERNIQFSATPQEEYGDILDAYSSQSKMHKESYILIYDDAILLQKSSLESFQLLAAKDFENFPAKEVLTTKISSIPQKLRLYKLDLKKPFCLVVCASLDEHEGNIKRNQKLFSQAVISSVIGAALLSWVFIAWSLRGLKTISSTAEDFGKGNLKARAKIKGRTSELSKLSLSFNSMADQLEKLIFEMGEITNSAAHDLRTPVTRIRGLAENSLLKDDEKQEVFTRIIDECDIQANIINDILALSQCEAGIVPRGEEKVNLKEILQDCYEMFSPAAEDKGIKMTLDLTDTNCHILGNATRIERSVANLVDNALKYSSEGEIILSLTSKNSNAELRVSDEGSGISIENRERIFDRFFRSDDARNSPGSGLGLSLVKSYIELHEGKVSVEDTKKGTTFLITLPLKNL